MNPVTPATTLTALRDADAPEAAIHATTAPHGAALGGGGARAHLTFSVHDDLRAIEADWRCFQTRADCSAFQTFDWLAAWQRNIGLPEGIRAAITVARFADGDIACILPLAVEADRFAKRLCWLGEDLCDYNAPLLAPDFSQRVTPARFRAAWRELRAQFQRDPLLRHDWIELTKMPRTLGGQINPLTHLHVNANASGAHLTLLGDNWETYYKAKRSSATRRRDRTKRSHMSRFGDICFISAADAADARQMVARLIEQKSQSLARKGVADIFARPGHREFFLDLASNPKTRDMIHVSRVEIGQTWAAANFGIIFRDCYYHVLASFNENSDFSRYGPGVLHLRELLAHAISRGLKRFDFTIGDEQYKLEWSDIDLKLYDYAVATTWRGLPTLWLSVAGRRIKRLIKQTPWLWRIAFRARSTLATLTRRPGDGIGTGGASEAPAEDRNEPEPSASDKM